MAVCSNWLFLFCYDFILHSICYHGYSDWYRDENVIREMACDRRNAKDLRTSKGMQLPVRPVVI
jgi:hypothetical protein